MKVKILILFILGFSIYKGVKYYLSDRFQKEADEKKLEWTCPIEFFLGGLGEVRSNYEAALHHYSKVELRCPKTERATSALYRMAKCYLDSERTNEAIDLYNRIIAEYPSSRYSRLSQRNIERLKVQ